MQSQFAQSKLIWQAKDTSWFRVESFRRYVNRKHGLKLRGYHDLHKYSVTDWAFWQDLWEYLGIIYSVPPEKIWTEGRLKEVPIWFPGARLNYAENVLRYNDDSIAVTSIRESGQMAHYSFRQVRNMVRDLAASLRANGLQTSDRVAAIVTNSVDAIVISLATISVGAIYSSTATDMGIQGILDRYRQIKPKFVFAETEITYAGKTIDLMPKVTQVVQDLHGHGLQRTILLPSARTGAEAKTAGMRNTVTMSQFLAMGDGRPLSFEQVPFAHPVWILYSSGTTGVPKCIVHSGGGTLMNNLKESAFGYNMDREDTYFQYTTTGWMMWNAMVPSLAVGCRVLAYDGSPFYPSVQTYLKMISDQDVTIWGTSPRFLTEVQSASIEPLKLASFEALRVIMSTGSPLTAPMFEWTQKAFGRDVHVVSVSGGTDICSGFVTACPILPSHAGEIQSKSLGMAVEIFDTEGKNIENTGQPGELVCTRPHPSLPVYFWSDKNDERYRKAYFDTYPGVWCHSDFIVKNPKTQGFIILGRSDGVLNPSGVRFGSAEIYTALERFRDEVDDTLCIGQRRPEDQDERVLLFVKMRPEVKFTDDLVNRIKTAIRTSLSARHVPAYIFEIADIPYTVNNKKIEIAVKHIVSGSNLKPSGTVANPESLQLYYKFRHLERLVGQPRAKL